MNYRTAPLLNIIVLLHGSYCYTTLPDKWREKAISVLNDVMTSEEARVILLELRQIDAGLNHHEGLDGRVALADVLAKLVWYELEEHFNKPENIESFDKELSKLLNKEN